MGKMYVVVAICVAALCCAVVYFDGPGGATENLFTGMANSSRPFLGATIANFIFTPLTLIFTNYFWAVGAGVFWPFAAIWLVLLLVAIGATIIGPAMGELGNVG